MKLLNTFYFLFAFSFVLSGCKKDDEPQPDLPPSTGTVELVITPMFGADTLHLDELYTSPAGEAFRVHNLKFFLSEIGLARTDNSESAAISDTFMHGVFLIDFTKPNFKTGKKSYKTTFKVYTGNYQSLRFNIGVPRKLNMADPTTAPAPLNIAQSHMYWSWNSGYIFMLAEGNGPDVAGNSFHFGIGENKRTMPFSFGDAFGPSPLVSIQEGKTTRILINFDFRKLLINGDGSNYSFSTTASSSVHGGYNADRISANAAHTMEFVSSAILP